jgi:excinuclease ABC subunit B
VRGDVVEVFPPTRSRVLRVEMFGDEIDASSTIDPLTGEHLSELQRAYVFPATHYVTGPSACSGDGGIEDELEERLDELEEKGKLLERAAPRACAPSTTSR